MCGKLYVMLTLFLDSKLKSCLSGKMYIKLIKIERISYVSYCDEMLSVSRIVCFEYSHILLWL